MMNNNITCRDMLEFKVYSGGTVTIDRARCSECDTKACIQVCQTQGGPLQLNAEGKTPELHFSLEDVEKGKCNECLGCELECDLSGRQAISICLPIAGFTEYLQTITQPIVYQRSVCQS